MMSKQKELAATYGTGTLERPLYSPGLLLEDSDLTSGVDYTRRLTQLLFSSLFGCGVICGLRVRADPECKGKKLSVKVEKGLGLDCFGNPIEIPSLQTIPFDPGCDPFPENIWVVACYVDKECSPRELSCGCDSAQDRAFTRHRAGFEIKLYGSAPECACSCEPPKKPESEPRSRCCDHEEPEPPNDDSTTHEESEWGCYDDHMNGVCSCGCGCTCIVIGKLKLSLLDGGMIVESADGTDRTMVRDIRPFLIGQASIRPRPRPEPQPESQPA